MAKKVYQRSQSRPLLAIEQLARDARPYIDFSALRRRLGRQGVFIGDELEDPWGRLPEDAVREDIGIFDQQVAHGMRNWQIPAVLRQQLDCALGRASSGMSRRLLLSNRRIRKQAALSLIDAVKASWDAGVRDWYFVSLIDDGGNALEYDTHVNFTALRDRFQAALDASQLNAVGFIELQAITNMPQQRRGRTLMFNAHALGWTTDPKFDAKQVSAALCQTLPLTSIFGAETVRIMPVKRHRRDVLWKARYMLKAPVTGKYLVRDRSTPSGWAFKTTIVREDLQVRVMEALTQLTYDDVMLASGTGVTLAAVWRRNLGMWHEEQRGRWAYFVDEGDMAYVWRLLRQRRSVIRRSDIRFDEHVSAQANWITAAAAWLTGKSPTRRSLR